MYLLVLLDTWVTYIWFGLKFVFGWLCCLNCLWLTVTLVCINCRVLWCVFVLFVSFFDLLWICNWWTCGYFCFILILVVLVLCLVWFVGFSWLFVACLLPNLIVIYCLFWFWLFYTICLCAVFLRLLLWLWWVYDWFWFCFMCLVWFVCALLLRVCGLLFKLDLCCTLILI